LRQISLHSLNFNTNLARSSDRKWNFQWFSNVKSEEKLENYSKNYQQKLPLEFQASVTSTRLQHFLPAAWIPPSMLNICLPNWLTCRELATNFLPFLSPQCRKHRRITLSIRSEENSKWKFLLSQHTARREGNLPS
jgi:hypothetical protein